MQLNKRPILQLASIPLSGSKRSEVIECDLARTVTVTGRCTYNAGATLGARINLYYSPDGVHFDTVPYAYFDIDFTAGAAVQETKQIDPPEVGYIAFNITNNDTGQAITNVSIWASVTKYWEDIHEAIDPLATRDGG